MFQTLVIAVLSIGIGLAACFMGYQLFRFLLPLLAALYGYAVAASWFSPEAWFWPFIIGLIVGLIFAFLAYSLWSITVGIGGVTLGFGAGMQLASFLGLGSMLAPVIGIVVALIFGFMFFSARDLLVMISTSLAGAGLALTGLAIMLPGLLGWLANSSNFLTFILTIVLAAIGFGTQYRTVAGRNIYAAMV
ncbi:MAG: hypothetical protein EOM24_27900 [Chloroflexia bacterium]|nr:hypothetical protein [Chloroflexia bacterium]